MGNYAACLRAIAKKMREVVGEAGKLRQREGLEEAYN